MCDSNNEERQVTTYCDCNLILRKYHSLLNKADELYQKSDYTIDSKVVEAINAAIVNLENAFELGGIGGEIEEKANEMLDKSRCNKIIKDCNELYAIAEETFSLESEYLTHALNLLKEVQKDIQVSISVRKIGYKIRDQYKECVNSKSQPPKENEI